MQNEKETAYEVAKRGMHVSAKELLLSIAEKDPVNSLIYGALLISFWQLRYRSRLQLSIRTEREMRELFSQDQPKKKGPPKKKRMDPKKTEELNKRIASISKSDLKPTYVNIFIREIGDSELKVLRIIRTVTELSFVEIKKLIEKSQDTPIFERVTFSDAQVLLELLKEAGATVALKAVPKED